MAIIKGSAFQMVVKTDKLLKEAVTESAQAAAEALALQFKEVVKRWRSKPKFVVVKAKNPFKGVGFAVAVEGTQKAQNRWIWTDKGTEPHIIRPVRAKALAFNVGYSAKTQPVAQFNVGTGRAKGKRVVTKVVNHPGTEARKFTKTFVEMLMPEFERDVQRQVKSKFRKR
jgi:hypothetical protein